MLFWRSPTRMLRGFPVFQLGGHHVSEHARTGMADDLYRRQARAGAQGFIAAACSALSGDGRTGAPVPSMPSAPEQPLVPIVPRTRDNPVSAIATGAARGPGGGPDDNDVGDRTRRGNVGEDTRIIGQRHPGASQGQTQSAEQGRKSLLANGRSCAATGARARQFRNNLQQPTAAVPDQTIHTVHDFPVVSNAEPPFSQHAPTTGSDSGSLGNP